ncbi:MAG: class I SAM-dependent methyltransferase [Thaumarchaeota archaeon]|nr:class I SAM-dependent methyltransferase [Nitrososphaerota archaeon]
MEEIRKQQREYWNELAPGWKKWEPFLMNLLRPAGEKILESVDLKDGYLVLDVATGSGEPGLTAAKRVGSGKVIGADNSEEMLGTAREKAKNLGINNFETRLLEGLKLPFASDHFDAVTCRFGVMFFPDLLFGVREMVRVLKPNRRLAVSVWGPRDNRAQEFIQMLLKLFDLPSPSPDSPEPYRCSERGKITSLLRDAQLSGIEETELRGQMTWESAEQYLRYVMETSPSIAFAMQKVSEGTRKKKEGDILTALNSIIGSKGEITFDWLAWVDSGVKLGA